ncbi:hypothetical protein B0H19DRAFT_1175608 [Mycena capillaripes]|nr:hypothetical protein B0H19DRAFT_1175608 [Mycena capillaripes]
MALEVGTIVMGVTHVTFAVVVVGRGGGGPVPVAARKLGGGGTRLCGLGTRRHHARSKLQDQVSPGTTLMRPKTHRVIATWLWSLVVIKPHSLELALLRSLSCLGDLGSLACFSGLHFLGLKDACEAFSVTVTVVVAMEFSRAGLVAVVRKDQVRSRETITLVILFVLCTASGLATGRGRGGSMRTAGLLRHCEWSSAIRRR